MASYNRVILMGNLTRDVELRYIPSGMAVCDIGLAVNDRRKAANGEWVDEVTFVDVTLWGRTAEIAGEYLSKGSSVLIEGRLKLDTWEKDGKKNSKLKVIAEAMRMVGAKGGGGGGGPPGGGGQGARPAARSGGGGRPAQPARGGDEYSQSSAEPDFDTGSGGGDDIPF